MKFEIKRLDREVPLPGYAHDGDAALDLHSAETITLDPKERRTVSTGIAIAVPPGHVGLVWDRSGLASKRGIHTMAGVIDSGYRGEVRVVMINLGEDPFEISKGDRIAQLLIQPVVRVEVEEVDELSDTVRGRAGFGSTGVSRF